MKKKFYRSDDFKNIEIRTGNIEVMIHDKIFLLSNTEKSLYRVVTGSANFTNAAFEKNFETVRVDDSEELYNLYLQRFNFLHQQTFIPPELNNLNKNSENKFTEHKSGFTNLDKKQNISSGLYVLGGAPQVGKTTFVWQLLEQFAENGENCIFCGYEITKDELKSKSENRKKFLQMSSTEETKDFEVQFLDANNRTIDDLLEILKNVCKDLEKPPIVAIDDLQKISSNFSKDKDGVRFAIDDILKKIKQFQRETNSTFFVISSLNQNGYDYIDLENFKEIDGIGCSADVIWGLKWKEKPTDDEKISMRQMYLICLKNIYGELRHFYFEFYPQFAYFKSDDETLNQTE